MELTIYHHPTHASGSKVFFRNIYIYIYIYICGRETETSLSARAPGAINNNKVSIRLSSTWS